MKRIIVLLTVATTMGAMVVLTASGAVAQGGPGPLRDFCDTVDGTITFSPPTCTWTVTTDPVEAQHDFTRATSQVYSINIMHLGQDPTLVDTFESCLSPGGREVPLDNPNCTLP